MKKSVVIIGGGLGGLFTGAILAKEGLQVTVLEKNSTAGGGLQTFKRFGCEFDTGMHVVCGMQKGGNIRKICKYLGIEDKINVLQSPDRLYVGYDGEFYDIAATKDGFVDSLSKYFPEERENLRTYVNALFNITDKIDLYNLRPTEQFSGMDFFSSTDDFMLPADVFIAKYLDNSKLRSIVAYTNTLYGGRAGKTPAYVHAIISVSFINGIVRFEDTSRGFKDLLVSVITENGGRVLTNAKVEKIVTENKNAICAKTQNGDYYADLYISDIHPCSLLQILDNEAFPKSYKNRLESIPNSFSAFLLYIKLKKNAFKYLDRNEYFMTNLAKVWDFGYTFEDWPLGFLFMTPPQKNQGEYADTALVTAPMPFDVVRKWENTTSGNRGKGYEDFKAQQTKKILSRLEKIHPGFADCIENICSSTPLTIRDFYNVKEGSLFGFSKDCGNIILSQIPVFTKIKNLLLTGQNVNLHGFCGVPLTAVMTSEAILGGNYITNKLCKI
ncbi:MAG: NAD(P)/FAD-dependent oxidoreductase [Bacteroidales bacterium]|nr:NAD(P)/FAD-dependent oxidoreductase [Bacteroidales bacterium]MBR4325584.1 NAD(P)/FAD-dependent oxidoreductase [Bacteroidales bacterium]